MKTKHRTILTRLASAALVLAISTACTVNTAHVIGKKPIAKPNQPWKAEISNQPDIAAETAYIRQRRKAAGVSMNEPTVALCFSGGGLRAATIQLGVLQGLEEKGLLKKADYLSSVSGGSYIASWYVSHLLPPRETDVRSKRLPFRGGYQSYTADRAKLLQLDRVNASEPLSPETGGAVDELMDNRGFVLGRYNRNASWLVPLFVSTIPFNYVFDMALHLKPVRGKFNIYHPSYFYESAIRRSYLTEPETLLASQENERDGFFGEKPHEIRLNEINPSGHSAPYLILNAAQANVPPGSKILRHQASHFEMSRDSVGGPFVGYVHSDHFGFPVESVQHNADGTGEVALRANSVVALPTVTKPLRLSWAVAASGAAFDSNGLGKAGPTEKLWPPIDGEPQPEAHNTSYKFLYFGANLINMNLRQQNRNFAMQPPGQPNSPWSIGDNVKDRAREMFMDRFLTTSESNTLILTDGGHFENLGVYAMLQRPKVKEIWSFDAAADGDYKFADWIQLAKLMQLNRWEIRAVGDRKLPIPKMEGNEWRVPEPPYICIDTTAEWKGGPVVWKDSPVFEFALRHERTGRKVTLYLVKSSFRADDGAELGLGEWFRQYRARGTTGKKFPHTSTGNVSFNTRDFTSYRQLGRVLAWKLAEERRSKK